MKALLVVAALFLPTISLASDDPALDKAVSRFISHNLKKQGNEVDSTIERYSLPGSTTPQAILNYSVNEAPDANNPKVVWSGFAVFTSRDGRWVEGGHETGTAEVDGKFIVASEPEYAEKDPLCCPSITVITKYALTAKGLHLVRQKRVRDE